jgi:hypothetical protein
MGANARSVDPKSGKVIRSRDFHEARKASGASGGWRHPDAARRTDASYRVQEVKRLGGVFHSGAIWLVAVAEG